MVLVLATNTVKRIDVDIAEQIISIAGDNRIPLPPVLQSSSPGVRLLGLVLLMTIFLFFFKMFQPPKKNHQTQVIHRKDLFPLTVGPQLSLDPKSVVNNF